MQNQGLSDSLHGWRVIFSFNIRDNQNYPEKNIQNTLIFLEILSFIHLSEWRHIDKPFPFFLCFGESSMIGDSDSPLSTSCISCVPTGDTSLTRFFEAGSCTGNVSSVGLGSFVSLLGS